MRTIIMKWTCSIKTNLHGKQIHNSHQSWSSIIICGNFSFNQPETTTKMLTRIFNDIIRNKCIMFNNEIITIFVIFSISFLARTCNDPPSFVDVSNSRTIVSIAHTGAYTFANSQMNFKNIYLSILFGHQMD